jgi:UbiD family decarboxylase
MANRTTTEKTPGPDLRSWIAALEAQGELRRVTAEVDWDQEIGAVTRINLGLKGPALLFEAIKGYRTGRCTRLMTAGLGNRRQICLMLGLPIETSDRALVAACRQRFRQGIPPVAVETGPVKQTILTGDAIDLHEFPVPRWHHLDGGRFIDTFCAVVTKDPEIGQINLGLYRGQVLGRDKIGKLLIPTTRSSWCAARPAT